MMPAPGKSIGAAVDGRQKKKKGKGGCLLRVSAGEQITASRQIARRTAKWVRDSFSLFYVTLFFYLLQ